MIGSRLGNWLIDRELGSGGMGRVYLAHEVVSSLPSEEEPKSAGEGTGRLAAIKVLAAELAGDPGFQQRFKREIEAVRRLDHPGIVHFYEAGQQDERFFYVMEYVEGKSFEDLLQ